MRVSSELSGSVVMLTKGVTGSRRKRTAPGAAYAVCLLAPQLCRRNRTRSAATATPFRDGFGHSERVGQVSSAWCP